MALATYQQLQDRIKRMLWDRDDLHGDIPDFIAMAEADFNSKIRVRAMEASDTITLTDGAGSLPSDYLAWRRVYANASPVVRLDPIEPSWAIENFPDTAAGTPLYFYISGSSIYTKPVSSSDLIMVYYQKIPALADNQGGNWLLTRAPNLYLYASLLHAAPMLDDDSRLQTWSRLRDEAASMLEESDATERYSRSYMRISGCTP